MSAVTSEESMDEDLKEVFERSNDPALNAVEVAEHLDISQQAAHSKLMKAYKDGNVERKKVGARAVVWWIED